MSQAAAGQPDRVSTLELFFDLVFVFVVSQLAEVLFERLTWASLGRVAVMLLIIFWMYGGYAWLTNNVPAGGGRVRLLLLGGMAAYLVLALAVPRAYQGTGLAFGLAYLAIVAIHTFLFVASAPAPSAAVMRGIGAINLVTAGVVVLGGAVGGTVQEVLWPLAGAGMWLTPFSRPVSGVALGAAHFVERHGLIVVVALGESVVSVGVGARDLPLHAALIATAAAGLAVSFGLWFAYFGRDDDAAAERALLAAAPDQRGRAALRGFGYAHTVLLLGIVLVAVGIKRAVAHPGDALASAEAFALAGGVAVFLLGDAWFRFELGLGRSRWRAGAAAAMLVTVPLGTAVSGAAALVAAAALLGGALLLEPTGPRGPGAAP